MSSGSVTWNFTYNADDLRTRRTNGTTTYDYTYNGSTLTQMRIGSDVLHFVYDASGMPMSVTYNGTNYYYVTNLQGDVIAILDTEGTAVVTYTYDAWGKILTTGGEMADTLGAVNPLRYRGYVYDQETQLYYLQSRYFDPNIGRFINADVYAATGQGFTGNNMFVYCLNNPTKFKDVSGFDAVILYDEDTFGHIGFLIQDESYDWWHFYWGTEGGVNGSLRRIACFFGFTVTPYTWCEEYDGNPNSLREINSSHQFSGDYEAMYYLSGDFSTAVEEAQSPTGQYNLYSNNCSQVSLGILSSANTIYSKTLEKATEYILPANAKSFLSSQLSITSTPYQNCRNTIAMIN
jgi:RHS repeat-associated protein